MNIPFSVFNALEAMVHEFFCSKVVLVENMHVLIIQKEAIEIARTAQIERTCQRCTHQLA